MIGTERLILRDWRDADLDPFAAMSADADVMRHLDGPIDRAAAAATIANTASWGLMLRLGMMPRPDLDFDHPRFAAGHPLRRHVVHAIDRPAA